MTPCTFLTALLPSALSYLTFLITITLLPLPPCTAQDVVYSIPEEQQPTTFVGNVARDINLEAQLPSAIFDNLHYSVLASSSSYGDLFSIDQDTADLFTSRRLDRETVCRFSLQCRLDFKVGAVAGTYFKNIRVRVLLNDVNDNAPRFNRSSFSLDIPESVTVGASFSLEGALDDDTGVNNSVQSYTISPSDGPFEISFTQKLDRTSDVTLYVREALDRETRRSYTLTLIASDGGVPLRTAEMTVTVNVLDNNDNAPIFSQADYSVTIGENVKPGERILTVYASDADEGVNSEVRYRLSAHQDSSVASLFNVGEQSGAISLQHLPASGVYSVIVQAVDGGSPPKEAQVVVEVRVIDTTNNPPVIVVTLLSAAVSEGSSLRFPVAHVSVEDPDSGSNGQVTCFSQSAYFDLRRLEEPDWMVELARSLDREDTASYSVTLFCRDSGSPSLNATATFTVAVEDENDNEPVFPQPSVTITLAEGDRTGEIVTTITATDRDLGVNAEVKYSVVNSTQDDAFYVLESSGSVVVARELDRETQDSYVLQILAVDGGIPPLSATATLTILIEDVNDEAPTFTQSKYNFTILENQPAGTLVGRFNATDHDLGPGGEVSFFLSTSQPLATSSFLLHTDGTLVTRGVLDRESRPEIVFDVMAADGGSPRLTTSKRVSVKLEDVNDNKPVFLFPGPTNHSVTLLIPIQRDVHLFTLSVLDADEGQNGALSYGLSSANMTSLFTVDTWTGEVRTRARLTEDHIGVHNLTFVATDGGSTPLSTYSSLYATVKLNPESQPVTSEDDKAVIVIIIVCATIFIAVIIVIVVCLVRRRDKGTELKYVNKERENSREKEKRPSTDLYIERQNTPSMFFTSASNGHLDTSSSPKLTIGYPMKQNSQPGSRWPKDSTQWDPDPLDGLDKEVEGEGDGGDLQTLNRVTSLRLQQAFEHISSIKSQLITGSDTGKPYEWREIHVPGRPEDFNSLSSRGTNNNADSGLGTDEDAVFLNNNTNTPHHHNHHHHHGHHHHHPAKKMAGVRSLSQPASDNSQDSSQQSCSSLPNLYLKPGSDILVFRPTSATSCESSPSMDDNCTTTSGSYSITFEDPLRDGGGVGKELRHVQDVYV